MAGPGDVDTRSDRLVQAVVGVLLLAAFVFRVPLVVPILAVAQGAGALVGVHANPFHWAYRAWIEPRLPKAAGDACVPEQTVRSQDVVGFGLLAIASLLFLLGGDSIGWLFVIVEAVIAVVAATTQVHLGDRLLHRLHRGH